MTRIIAFISAIPLWNLISIARAIEKEMKVIQIGKEEIKLSLFAEDMTLYVGNLKEFTRKLLELKSSLKLQDIISTQKSVVFLYNSNEQPEKEISKPFTIVPKQEGERHMLKTKTLLKEIKNELNKWKDVPCL